MDHPNPNASLYRKADGYGAVEVHYDRAFQRMGIPYETRFVDTRFGPTHTVLCGDAQGAPLVLWHGLNTNATSWIGWIPAFASDYRIYAIDTVGGMGKSAPTRPDPRGSDYGLWAADVLGGLDLDRANMIGASNGGWLVLKLASVAPERITCTVLMSSAGFAPMSFLTVLRMIPVLLRRSHEEIARRLMAVVSPPDLPLDPAFLELFELTLRSGFRSKPFPPALPDEEIAQLIAPTYLLMGEYENSFNPYKATRHALRTLPNVIAAEIVPDVGHAMLHRQPDWVTKRVRAFLDRYALL
jgi:pimeloyl-ACP methyl ester carboxylesterase